MEAVPEETASTEGVQVERQSTKGGRKLGSLAGLRGNLCKRNGLGDRAAMS